MENLIGDSSRMKRIIILGKNCKTKKFSTNISAKFKMYGNTIGSRKSMVCWWMDYQRFSECFAASTTFFLFDMITALHSQGMLSYACRLSTCQTWLMTRWLLHLSMQRITVSRHGKSMTPFLRYWWPALRPQLGRQIMQARPMLRIICWWYVWAKKVKFPLCQSSPKRNLILFNHDTSWSTLVDWRC